MKKNDILILLIPSVLIVVLWVIFSVYHNYVTSTIPKSLSTQILSINPDFNLNTINNLKKRNSIEPIYQISGNQSLDKDLTITNDQLQTGSSSAKQASSGGQLLQ